VPSRRARERAGPAAIRLNAAAPCGTLWRIGASHRTSSGSPPFRTPPERCSRRCSRCAAPVGARRPWGTPRWSGGGSRGFVDSEPRLWCTHHLPIAAAHTHSPEHVFGPTHCPRAPKAQATHHEQPPRPPTQTGGRGCAWACPPCPRPNARLGGHLGPCRCLGLVGRRLLRERGRGAGRGEERAGLPCPAAGTHRPRCPGRQKSTSKRRAPANRLLPGSRRHRYKPRDRPTQTSTRACFARPASSAAACCKRSASSAAARRKRLASLAAARRKRAASFLAARRSRSASSAAAFLAAASLATAAFYQG
jgi:hypothetical protein